MKKLINEVKRLTILKDNARDQYFDLIDSWEDKLCDGLITDEEYIKVDEQAQEETNYNLYSDQLLKAENELLKQYKQGLKDNGLLSEEIKDLFNAASKNVTIHNKLIKKIIEEV